MMNQEKKMVPWIRPESSEDDEYHTIIRAGCEDHRRPEKGKWPSSRGQSSVISQGSEVGKSMQWKVSGMDLLLGVS